MNSFLKELQEVYPLSFVILTTWQQGKQGVYLDPDIYYSMYAHECPVPILTVMDNGLGKGIFGGIVTFADQMGSKPENRGENFEWRAGESHTDRYRSSYSGFDENQLKRWRVERKNLPAKSLIVNERDAFWRTYGNYILIAGMPFILLLLLVLFLVLSHLRYRKMLHRSIFLEKAAQQMARDVEEKDRNIV